MIDTWSTVTVPLAKYLIAAMLLTDEYGGGLGIFLQA